MALRKKSPREQMRYWRVGLAGNTIVVKARSARVAIRKYVRGNLVHDVIVREFELPFGGPASTPNGVYQVDRRDYVRWARRAGREVADVTAVPMEALAAHDREMEGRSDGWVNRV